MKEKLSRIYTSENVLCAAQKRIALIFDEFEKIIVSISSGKDSTVLFWLALNEAIKRNRKIRAFFLDQEAEYESSIELMELMMSQPLVEPLWYQIPLRLTNATSYSNSMFYCWEEDKEWLRSKHPLAIHSIIEKYPDRFYSFFNWMEKKNPDTAFLIGLRAEEGINRLKAVMLYPGCGAIRWSTRTKGKNTFRFYPIYDWGVSDIWKFIYDNGVPYNSVYDRMYHSNKNYYKTMRVSNLIHEKSFKCLGDLQIYEPEMFDRLIKRMPGVHIASIYSKEKTVFSTDELPKGFDSWHNYKDFLLKTTPLEHKVRFEKRFSKQPKNEDMARKQVRQILINDYENNLKIKIVKRDKNELYEKWWKEL